jgi:hypothetical protein
MSDAPQTPDVAALRANIAHYDQEIARLEAAKSRTKARQAGEVAALARKQRDELAGLDEALRSHSQNRHNAIMALADGVIAETAGKDAPNA